ncbi:MAG: hypothetical protein QXL46_00380, partial [Nitrososphaerales archaeon]
ESKIKHTVKEIWESTASTFMSKFIFAMTFIVPILLFPLKIAIIMSVIWGLSLLGIFSFYIAKEQKVKAWRVIMEHLIIALVVIIMTNIVGDLIRITFV